MYPLSPVEVTVYFAGWTFSVLYSMYKCQVDSDRYKEYLWEDLVKGWTWTGRQQDAADFEWTTCSRLLWHWLPFVAAHLVLSLTLKNRRPGLVPGLTVTLSSLWLWRTLGLKLTLLLVAQPLLLSAVAHLTSSLRWIWTATIATTLALHQSRRLGIKDWLFGHDAALEQSFMILLAWTQARSISYGADTMAGRSRPSTAGLLHYCLYLPLLPTGPLVRHCDFQKSVSEPAAWSWSHARRCFWLLGRCFFWWAFQELALHYSYHAALQYHPYLVERMDMWTAGGLGYSLAQFFMLKYYVFYGLPSSLARLDRVEAAGPPICIGRVHLYSQMWRRFDRGLYDFMVAYIYVPAKGSAKGGGSGEGSAWPRLRASALTFLFVAVWHGATASVLVWSAGNFAGICAETAAGRLVRRRPLIALKARLSEANWIRLEALVSAPLLLMSALSNFYFFTNMAVGTILARKAFVEGYLLVVLAILYCCCHVSLALQERPCPSKQLRQ